MLADVLSRARQINYRFPPIDKTKKDRCKFLSSAIGQANAARDSLYDLRECPMTGKDAAGFDLSGALMEKGDFSKVNFKETQLSKVAHPPGATPCSCTAAATCRFETRGRARASGVRSA